MVNDMTINWDQAINNKILIILLIFLLAIGALFVLNEKGNAETITVGKSGGADYSKIQDAYDASKDGDTIRVWEGTYNENIEIYKSLTFIGNGSSNTTITTDDDDIVKIYEDNVNISGFSIIDSNQNGISIHSDYNKISFCDISNNFWGNLIFNSIENIISYCNISDSEFYGIKHVDGSKNMITNCNILNNKYGITIGKSGFYETHNNTISNCIITNNDDYGLYFEDTNSNIIMNCEILDNNEEGIYLYESNNNIISDCIIDNNKNGTYLSYSNNNTISDCNILYNGPGIYLRNSNKNKIHENYIRSNGGGIYIYKSKFNTISCCNFPWNSKYNIFIDESSDNSISYSAISNHVVELYKSNNNIISTTNFTDNNKAITLDSSNYNEIINCNISNNNDGITLEKSNKNKIYKCNFIGNTKRGIWLQYSKYNNISDNNFIQDGIVLEGYTLSDFIHIIENNIINNNPLLYYKNKSGIHLDKIKAGQIILANCSDFIIENLNISDTDVGIFIGFGKNNKISNCNFTNNYLSGISLIITINNLVSNCSISNNLFGIYLYNSSFNNITNNIFSYNTRGIYFTQSSNNTINKCNFEYCTEYGISFYISGNDNKISNCDFLNNAITGFRIDRSNKNIISNCVFLNNKGGITFYYSNNNKISNCNFSSNDNGISISDSNDNEILKCNLSNMNVGFTTSKSSNNILSKSNLFNNDYGIKFSSYCIANTIFNCNISDNEYGIYINDFYSTDTSNGNIIYHNNFLKNNQNSFDECSNQWDNGREGNYFDDHIGDDDNEDGIFDTPYDIPDGNNKDRYPLVKPYHDGPIIADAGNYPVVKEDIEIKLDGSNSTDNVAIIEWTWTFTYNESVEILNGKVTFFTFWTIGNYEITLSVKDIYGNTDIDTTWVNATENTPPVADAGADQVGIQGTLVTFNGRDSYDNIGIVNWTWTFNYNSTYYELYEKITQFTFNIVGNYSITLTVIDTINLCNNDTMWINVTDITLPEAVTGFDKEDIQGTFFTLNGSDSFDNVGIVNWTWSFTYNNTDFKLYGEIVQFRFWTVGNYQVTLTVKDAVDLLDIDYIWINITDKTPPTANAGLDQNISEGSEITFDGSGSVDNVGIITWTWDFIINEITKRLYGEKQKLRFWTIGEFEVKLTVTDAANLSDSDSIRVRVNDITPPVAKAGPNYNIIQGHEVIFNGGDSSDNVEIVNWTWTFLEEGLKKLYGISPKYTFNNIGNFLVNLTVQDSANLSNMDKIWINVTAFGSINVIVKDEKGNPIENTILEALDFEYLLANTDEKGIFIYDNMIQGTYNISIKKEGYNNIIKNVIVKPGIITSLDIVLITAKGSINGLIKDENGNPIENAQVEILHTYFSVKTNKSGTYSFKNVPVGTYTIRVSKNEKINTIQVTIIDGKTTNQDMELIIIDTKIEEDKFNGTIISMIIIITIIIIIIIIFIFSIKIKSKKKTEVKIDRTQVSNTEIKEDIIKVEVNEKSEINKEDKIIKDNTNIEGKEENKMNEEVKGTENKSKVSEEGIDETIEEILEEKVKN